MGSMAFISNAFNEGGWGMWPILFLSVFVIWIGIDRVIYLYFKSKFNKEAFIRGIHKHILAGNLERALQYCSAIKSPLSNVVKAGLVKVDKGDAEVQAAMDEASLRELPRIERRTGYLAMLGNVATLMGLLGTITGMIKSFAGVAVADPAEKATMLAKGIAEAMNCTAFGLIVAIPALLLFAVLNGKTQVLVDDINETSVSVLNLIVTNRDKFNLRGGAPSA